MRDFYDTGECAIWGNPDITVPGNTREGSAEGPCLYPDAVAQLNFFTKSVLFRSYHLVTPGCVGASCISERAVGATAGAAGGAPLQC